MGGTYQNDVMTGVSVAPRGLSIFLQLVEPAKRTGKRVAAASGRCEPCGRDYRPAFDSRRRTAPRS